MPWAARAVTYCDLIRMTVLLSAASATVLAVVTVLAAGGRNDTTTLVVAAAWWPIAFALGAWFGRPTRAADAVRGLLAGARTATALPSDNPGRAALSRLWPVGVFAVASGVVGIFFPGVAAVAAGYGMAVAMAWRSRERAVTAIEERDGVRFYVEPGSALEPVRLVRSPGLRRGRDPSGSPGLPPAGR